ncbi:MAG: GTPase Era [Mariprofundales bacterium]
MIKDTDKTGDSNFKFATIALIGKANVGKSTLLNHIIGDKIAIVTPKPQTTRHRILGIHTDDSCQFAFVDTPGVHSGKTQMSRNMVRTAYAAAEEADIIAIMQDVRKPLGGAVKQLIQRMSQQHKPRIHLLNKVDKISKLDLLPRLAAVQALDPEAVAYIPISALRGSQVKDFISCLLQHAELGEAMYDADWYTDQSQRTLAAEYVREQVFLAMYQELPFQTAVLVRTFEEDSEKRIIEINADILIANERHKPILLGKQGARIKHIGTHAREGLETLFGCRVRLYLWIKVQHGWFDNLGHLQELGLNN